MQVNINEAKTNLSSLIQRVLQGDEVVIARARTPLVRLVRVEQTGRHRELGLHRGKVELGRDFNAPLEDFKDYVK